MRLRRSKIRPVVELVLVMLTRGSRRDVHRGGLCSGSAVCFCRGQEPARGGAYFWGEPCVDGGVRQCGMPFLRGLPTTSGLLNFPLTGAQRVHRVLGNLAERYTHAQPIDNILGFGGRTRTRTWDPLIKSQLLYQLSYAPIPWETPLTRDQGTTAELVLWGRDPGYSKAAPACR